MAIRVVEKKRKAKELTPDEIKELRKELLRKELGKPEPKRKPIREATDKEKKEAAERRRKILEREKKIRKAKQEMREREMKKEKKKWMLSESDGHKKKAPSRDMKKKPAARTIEELNRLRRQSRVI